MCLLLFASRLAGTDARKDMHRSVLGFSMFGDHLLDVAGAFGFFRMYEPNRAAIRKALLPKVLVMLAPEEQPRFFRYLLSHAILTSDLYVSEPDPRQNGHFYWAAEVLSEPSYWEGQG